MVARLLPAVVAACLAVVTTAAPAGAKTGRTYFTDAEVATIRARAKEPAYRKELDAVLRAAAPLVDRSDEEIWGMVPEADVPRALNVRFGTDCPVHGKEIFKAGGHYPWILSPDKPFKVVCPVGHEVYPSNDYGAYLDGGRKEKLDTKQPYVDDGRGWVDAEGNRYFFAAYYTFWQRWRREIIDGTEACGKAYLATEDAKYAHKAAVCLARLSQVYPELNFSKQGIEDGKYPSGLNGRVNDYIWENATAEALARAYDAVFPLLAGDEGLRQLAASKGVADVGAAVEKNILQVQVADIFAKKIRGNKFELGSLSTLALVLGNEDPSKGATTKQMVEWLLTGGGELEYTFYNGFDRDGVGGESSPFYSSIWNNRFVQAAENLSRLGVDITKDRKWLRLAKGPAGLRILDGMAPRIGDTGGGIGGAALVMDPEILKFGVEHFGDADCAKWLIESFKKRVGKSPTTQAVPLSDDQLFARGAVSPEGLRELAAGAAFPDAPYTRDVGGYGLAILELDDGGAKRSATMYYGGPNTSHQHRDRLTLGYYVNGREVLSELGYPSHWGPAADFWVKNTPSHYCVMVDGQAQSTRLAGHLTRFADLDGLKVASADGTAAWSTPPAPAKVAAGLIQNSVQTWPDPPPVKAYRRTLALLDTGEKSTLLIDAFLVQGGGMHDYSFHGLPYGKFECDLKPVKEQGKGTLAGEDVEYAQDPGGSRKYAGYQFMMKPKWYAPTDVTRLGWKDDAGLNQVTWFPRLAFDEVIVVDTVPPLGPSFPRSMPYVLLRKKGENLTSLFLGITDTTAGRTKVKAVRRITASSPAAGGAEVEMASGVVWRIYVNESGGDVTFEGGAAGNIPVAAVRVEGGRPAVAKVVGAGRLTMPGVPTIEQRPVRARVEAVDYSKNTVRVAEPLPAVPGGRGTVVSAVTGGNAQSYMVRSADGPTLGFGEVGLITGRFLCAWDPGQKKLVAQERTGGEYNQFDGKSFIGMTAVSEDLSTTATITGYDREANTFTIDADPVRGGKFTDVDGDGRSYVYVADIAPGTALVATPAGVVPLRP